MELPHVQPPDPPQSAPSLVTEPSVEIVAADGSVSPGAASVLSLPHVAARLFNTPLLIERGKLRVILSALGHRFGVTTPALPIEAALTSTDRPARPRYDVIAGVAVIPIIGTLVQRSSWMDALSGLISYEQISTDLAQALADPAVKHIVLEFDSPGGEIMGLPELAQEIRAATRQKPVAAFANGAAFSAAYWLASAAGKTYLTAEGGMGSVGVIYLHVDATAAVERGGYKVDEIFAGDRKVDASPYSSLTPERRTQLQSYVNTYYEQFVSAVADYRTLAPDVVRQTQAALYIGEQAVSIGFADGVKTKAQILVEQEDEAMNKPTYGTAAELRAAQPALVADIETSARQAERERIKGILSLVPPALRAKAETIAFEQDATKAEAALSLFEDLKKTKHLAAFTNDGPAVVPTAALDGNEGAGDVEEQLLLESAQRIAARRAA